MKKIIITALCLVLTLCTLTSCSRPPEFSEIEGRLRELIDASYEINDLLFGEGLEVYPRVYEEKRDIYRTANGDAYYYYELDDATLGRIYAYRGVYEYKEPYKYLRFSESEISGSEAVYSNDDGYFYAIDYEEPESEYEIYYDEDVPENYSYVRFDSKYISVEQIKEAAEKVYSKEYLEGVYEMLFTGAVVDDSESGQLGARYYNYTDSNGQSWLMESDKYESSITGKRIYDFSTAKVLRRGSKSFVNIEIESYIEGKPDERVKVTLSMTMQDDGKWYLDSPTY